MISIIERLRNIYTKSAFKYNWVFYLSIITSIVLSLTEASFLGSIYALINHLSDPMNNNFVLGDKIFVLFNNFFDLSITSLYLILSGIIIIKITFLKILNTFLNTFLYYKINTVVSSKIFFNTISQDLKFHNSTNSSYLISAIIQKSKSTGEITFFVLNIIKSLCMLITITLFSIYFSSKDFLLFFLLFFIIFYLIYIIFKKKIKNLGIKIASSSDSTIKILQENYSSVIFIILYKCQKIITKTLRKSVTKLRKSEAQVVFLSTVPYIFIQTFTILAILFFIHYFQLKNNFISFIPLAAMWLLAIQRLIPSFNELFTSLSSIKSLEQNFEDTESLLNLYNENDDKELKNQDINFDNKIKFQDVSFSYDAKSIRTIDKLNFQIKKKTIFGIKGKTGSGKTTLINLLIGNYQPSSGNLLIDDIQLSKKNLNSWKNKIAYVPQKVFLFDDSIRSNIAFAEENIDEDLIKKAINIACLDEFIDQKEEGLNSIIGENADRISGGQKQRIGIARAIYKNTDIIILDEALNSLDRDTKIKVLENLKLLNKTIILISHDNSDFDICDNFINLN
jgi:ABC-type multidrug transport system fused ATPase/permease subunit|tara:strand:+ start:334 stop:2028 length:1695 start_codon:yes stop_codon:yes gene_type:complete